MSLSAPSYTVAAGDLGYIFELQVTATNSNGSTTFTTPPLGPVTGPPPASTSAPSLSVQSGGWYVGGVVSCSNGGWTNASTYAKRWLSCDANGMACMPATGMGNMSTTYTIAAAD